MTAFERLVATLDYPLFVVTAASSGGERSGCLVGFASQVSIKPPRFLACLSVRNHTLEVARSAEHLVVHVLREDDKETAELFGGETGDEVDKFEHTPWHPGPGGAPVLERAEAWFAGRVLAVHEDLGDHVGFLLEPVEADATAAEPGSELSFQQAKDIDPGHEP